jgi:uncharacterized protein YegJ (DUF2314 family)
VARNVPQFPPLSISDDDPLMKEAEKKARGSIEQFRSLVAEYPSSGRVKVPFQTNAAQTEYLWAEVRKLNDRDVEVLYITPPVSHTGKLERIHTHSIDDIVDWAIKLPNGNFVGGFTMRVMFKRGREQWGSLPPDLAAEESKYVEQ